jgi:SacI homology domain
MRKTEHELIQTSGGSAYIISSLSWRTDAQLIKADGRSGELSFCANFASAELAKARIMCEPKSWLKCDALIGYVQVGCGVGYLVGIQSSSSDYNALLCGSHRILTVKETCWLRIGAEAPQESLTKFEEKQLKLLCGFPLEGLHFYCESADLTRPFPSARAVWDADDEFRWNAHLCRPFERIGLARWCCVLLQGVAIARRVTDDCCVALVTRKSRKNPGTRYFARGLNGNASPGNECECELLMWKETVSFDGAAASSSVAADGDRVPLASSSIDWASYVWRRGTVPLWWRTELRTSVSEPEVMIRDKPYEGADLYYASIAERYESQVLTLFNMLRCEPGQRETTLTEYFQESLRYVKSRIQLDVRLVNFDWHHNLKQLGADHAIRGLWAQLEPIMRGSGLNRGRVLVSPVANNIGGDMVGHFQSLPDGRRARLRTFARQSSVVRFNCADSLDRTNVATFFFSFQLCAEMFRLLEVSSPAQREQQESPAGDNVKSGGSELPPKDDDADKWIYFGKSLEEVAGSLRQPLVDALTEMFVHNGDVVSLLYTNSPAIHTTIMREFSSRVSSGPIDTFVALQRRYQNLFNDRSRQAQYEMFLGIDWPRHFPSSLAAAGDANSQLELLSKWPATLLRDIDGLGASARASELLLHSIDRPQAASVCWLCPTSHMQTVDVLLTLPARVTGIVLYVGAEQAAPLAFDLYMGEHLDALHPIFQRVQLPRAPTGAALYYPIDAYDRGDSNASSPSSPSSSTSSSTSSLLDEFCYDFRGLPAQHELAARHRICRFVFHGRDGEYLALGAVEVFGVPNYSASLRESSAYKLLQRHQSRMATDTIEMLTASRHGDVDNDDSDSDSDDSGSDDSDNVESSDNGQDDGMHRQQQPGDARKEYRDNVVRRIVSSSADVRLSFDDVLTLEQMRLRLGLTCAERDETLLASRVRIEELNPLRFLRELPVPRPDDMRRARKKSSRCQNDECGQAIGFLASSHQCQYCFKHLCSSCIEPDGGARHVIIEFASAEPHAQLVCARCASRLQRQRGQLRMIRSLARRQRATEQIEAHAALQVLGTAQQATALRDRLPLAAADEQQRSEKNLSLYPHAALVNVVPSDAGSPPAESVLFAASLLASIGAAAPGGWRAPAELRSVTLTLALATRARVSRIAFASLRAAVVDVRVAAGNTFGSLKERRRRHAADDRQDRALWRAEAPFKCRFVRVTLVGDASSASPLGLARLSVLGTRVVDNGDADGDAPLPAMPRALADKQARALNAARPLPKIALVKSARTVWSHGNRRCEIATVEPTLVRGFRLRYRNSSSAPPRAAGVVHVSAFAAAEQASVDLSSLLWRAKEAPAIEAEHYRHLGYCVAPNAHHSASLVYTFARPSDAPYHLVLLDFEVPLQGKVPHIQLFQ